MYTCMCILIFQILRVGRGKPGSSRARKTRMGCGVSKITWNNKQTINTQKHNKQQDAHGMRIRRGWPRSRVQATANLHTKILDLRGFDSSIILILRGGIRMSIGNIPESLSQAILIGIILVGRLGTQNKKPCRCSVGQLIASGSNTTCNEQRTISRKPSGVVARWFGIWWLLNAFQTTLTPNPEKLHKYYSVTKQ